MSDISLSVAANASNGVDASSLTRAVIINLDRPGPPITCLFNPKEYRFSKSNTWSPGVVPGTNLPRLDFAGGQSATLQMQLFFDTYAQGLDVRKAYTDAIWALMLVDETLIDTNTLKGRPPRVLFQWGSTWLFEAVITAITQTFTLFLPTGIPVRATLDVTFQQFKDEKLFPRQNPSSGGRGGERLWTVRAGDTLPLIAYKHYGDCARWPLIADANRLQYIRRLTPGTVLVIPHE